MNTDIHNEEVDDGPTGNNFSRSSLSDARAEILQYAPSDSEKVKLLGIELIPNHHGNLKMVKADSLGQIVARDQTENQGGVGGTVDLNSKFDVKNFPDVYISEKGSNKYNGESSV